MYSVHLTGNPWFLLIILPGLWIIWKQYQGLSEIQNGKGLIPKPKLTLFFLQALALIVLVVSLTAPELRRHKVEFHNPSIIILRDQSGSFRAGSYLGIGSRYLAFQKTLAEFYGARNFDIREVDFSATAGLQSGNPAGSLGELTSLDAANEFVDSVAVPNLQAVFLFSDGRANLDSGKATRTWNVPLFPIIFSPDSISEIQPERVSLDINGEAAHHESELILNWNQVGRVGEEMAVRLLQGKKTVFTQRVSLDKIASGVSGGSTTRLPWNPDKTIFESGEKLRAVLQPGKANENTNPFNDTLEVGLPSEGNAQTIHMLRPIRSLDEKSMLEILQSLAGARISFFGMEDIGRLAPSGNDQIWVEAGALAAKSGLLSWLQFSKAKVVIYSRPDVAGLGTGRNVKVTGLAGVSWNVFSPAADVKVERAAVDAFPDEVVRLKGISETSLEAPVSTEGSLITLRERGSQGMLMGRISIGSGKRAFFFCLPAVWNSLFDPLGDFSMRENVAGYVKAAHTLANLDDGAMRVSRPTKVFHLVPFDLDFRFPERGVGNVTGKDVVLSITGIGFSKEWAQPESRGDEKLKDLMQKDLRLPAGKYLLELKTKSSSLWRDSLQVLPQVALELGTIGFDYRALEEMAMRSGGKILELSDSTGVTSLLPKLTASQIRIEKVQSTKLYNRLVLCLFILVLLCLSWLLRKKWDLD